MAILVVHGWHTECGNCGYGSGGWASNRDFPRLHPASEKCHGCGERFTEVQTMYGEPYEGDFEDDEV